jgi:hypothetical protein
MRAFHLVRTALRETKPTGGERTVLTPDEKEATNCKAARKQIAQSLL